MDETLIKVENIEAGYENKTILKKVSFEIKSRDFIGVIGPNGGGKTTLLKVLLGLITPFQGRISYTFGNQHRDFRKSIGYLPQQNNIDKRFPISVREVVLSGLLSEKSFFKKYTRADMQKADRLLEENGLWDIRSNPVGEISGGQLQRVFLSRALISSPKLLILDEPDTFVDNRFEHELYMKLKELNKELAILLVSHDIGTISSYIKTIACVNTRLHYHNSNKISSEQLKVYNCPIDLISHGNIPHRVLGHHK